MLNKLSDTFAALNSFHDAVLTEQEKYNLREFHANTGDEPNQVVKKISEDLLYAQAAWKGLFSGLYSSSKKGQVEKPSEDCLGQWLVDDINHLRQFKHDMATDYWSVTLEEYEDAWFGLGNIMFKNFDECHFKPVLQDLKAYCSIQVEDETDDDYVEPPMISACSGRLVWSHLQKNMFALVTQFSALGATFQQPGWEDMDPEEKAYSYQQVAHTVGELWVELTGFRPTNLDNK